MKDSSVNWRASGEQIQHIGRRGDGRRIGEACGPGCAVTRVMLDSIVPLWINAGGHKHRLQEKWLTTERAIPKRMSFGDGEAFLTAERQQRISACVLVQPPIL